MNEPIVPDACNYDQHSVHPLEHWPHFLGTSCISHLYRLTQPTKLCSPLPPTYYPQLLPKKHWRWLALTRPVVLNGIKWQWIALYLYLTLTISICNKFAIKKELWSLQPNFVNNSQTQKANLQLVRGRVGYNSYRKQSKMNLTGDRLPTVAPPMQV